MIGGLEMITEHIVQPIRARSVTQTPSPQADGKRTPARALPCVDCALREGCLPAAMSAAQGAGAAPFLAVRQKVRRGHALYRAGEPLRVLYAIRRGMFKSQMIAEDGREQMTGIHFSGEIVGT